MVCYCRFAQAGRKYFVHLLTFPLGEVGGEPLGLDSGLDLRLLHIDSAIVLYLYTDELQQHEQKNYVTEHRATVEQLLAANTERNTSNT